MKADKVSVSELDRFEKATGYTVFRKDHLEDRLADFLRGHGYVVYKKPRKRRAAPRG